VAQLRALLDSAVASPPASLPEAGEALEAKLFQALGHAGKPVEVAMTTPPEALLPLLEPAVWQHQVTACSVCAQLRPVARGATCSGRVCCCGSLHTSTSHSTNALTPCLPCPVLTAGFPAGQARTFGWQQRQHMPGVYRCAFGAGMP
jgi:hypothetical protein